jgi:hypothetical protein
MMVMMVLMMMILIMMMIKIMVMIMIMIIIMVIWMNEGASGAQASRAIPCTSEPKSRAHMGCFPKTQKHHKSTFLHLEPNESWR